MVVDLFTHSQASTALLVTSFLSVSLVCLDSGGVNITVFVDFGTGPIGLFEANREFLISPTATTTVAETD